MLLRYMPFCCHWFPVFCFVLWDVEVLWAFAKQGGMLERGFASSCTNLSTRITTHSWTPVCSQPCCFHGRNQYGILWNLTCLGLVWGCLNMFTGCLSGPFCQMFQQESMGKSPIWFGKPWATRFWQCWLLRRNLAPHGTLCWGTPDSPAAG